MKKEKIKIGIIGAGGIVENSHLPVLKNADNAVVSWVHDKNTRRSSLLSSMYNVMSVGEAALESAMDEVDVCLLTVPYGVRRSFIEACASKGKGLYVEKPFAMTTGEHQYYCNLFPVYKLAVGFQRRYYENAAMLASVVKSGVFGDLEAIEFKQGYFALKGGGGYLASAALAGGGVIVESAIHVLDQLLMITEAVDVKVLEVKSFHKDGIDYDTEFTSQIGTPKKTILVNGEISTLRNLENGVMLKFKNATLRGMLSCDGKFSVTGSNGDAAVFDLKAVTSDGFARSVTESFHIFWMEFLKAFVSKEPNATSGNSSLLTTSWIEQIYKTIKLQ